jgi:hypothetical protein
MNACYAWLQSKDRKGSGLFITEHSVIYPDVSGYTGNIWYKTCMNLYNKDNN